MHRDHMKQREEFAPDDSVSQGKSATANKHKTKSKDIVQQVAGNTTPYKTSNNTQIEIYWGCSIIQHARQTPYLCVARLLVEHKRQRECLAQAMQTQRQVHRRPGRPRRPAQPPPSHDTRNSAPGAGRGASPSEKRVAHSGAISALFLELGGQSRA